MVLEELGFNEYFERRFREMDPGDCQPARVVWQSAYDYLVVTAAGEMPAAVTGKVKSSQRPAVGDWVAARPLADGTAAIVAVLPRQSAFLRKAAGRPTQGQVVAANVDTVFIVAGLDGELNLRRVERYVTLVFNSGADPVVVLNKVDLERDPERVVSEVAAVCPGVPVLTVSALAPESAAVLNQYIGPGKTAAFLGSSGVGKSTLVNALLGQEKMATADVRDTDSKGRHTTSHRELAQVPEGGAVIDTPGMREIQVWGGEEGLSSAFPDIAGLSDSCRFRDCRHGKEPGCAVQAAVVAGDLAVGRLESFVKLRSEFESLESRLAETARREERRRGKRFSRMVKEVNEHNPKRKKR